MMKWL